MFGNDEVPFYEPSSDAKMRRTVLVGIAIVACVVILGSVISCSGIANPASFQVSTAEGSAQNAESDGEASASQASICVHVLGCVARPGVYQLPEDARIIDAVNAAGGFTEDASQEALNLASHMEDGAQVKVPSVAEVTAASEGDGGAEGTSAAAGGQGYVASPSDGKININTATATELQKLSGVGESTAQKIIAYRQQNGPFSAIEDIMNVSGIGEKKFAAIKDAITV
ncbi:MAG: ComEA family DNA-binding protein [Coriobacteriia bacterium]|nr:ComEA family DNA-binding protein [Coriobacteriia bacterium]